MASNPAKEILKLKEELDLSSRKLRIYQEFYENVNCGEINTVSPDRCKLDYVKARCFETQRILANLFPTD